MGGGGGLLFLINVFFVFNVILFYKLDNDFNKIYDEKGNFVYNYVNFVFNDMNILVFLKMDIYNIKMYWVLISLFIDLNIFGVYWCNSFFYDYINMDEMCWYNLEYGNGVVVDGWLSKYVISDIIFIFISMLNYVFFLFNDYYIGLLVGYEVYKNIYFMFYVYVIGFFNSEMIELSMVFIFYEIKLKKDYECM